MPEYLSPGVYIEETSYRAKSIEGVSTSTAGFIGPTRTGPISGQPELITSFADFTRIYGGFEDLSYGVNYLAHGVRAFFDEGGQRCYVVRVFNRDQTLLADCYARADITQAPNNFAMMARFPGEAGRLRVTFRLVVGRNVRSGAGADTRISRVLTDDIVAANNALHIVSGRGTTADPFMLAPTATPNTRAALSTFAGQNIYPLSVQVDLQRPLANNEYSEPETLGIFSVKSLFESFVKMPTTRFAALTTPFMFTIDPNLTDRGVLLTRLFGQNNLQFDPDASPQPSRTIDLAGGSDGALPQASNYEGQVGNAFDDLSEDDAQTQDKNGLLAFEAVSDISIIAAPGYTADRTPALAFEVAQELISHCEKMKYRVAVLDTPHSQTVSTVRDYRNLHSSKHAALYYPWIWIADPRPGFSGKRLKLPPSGFVAGIYARNDTEREVFKAPANEVVRSAVDFEQRLSKAHQDVLNPNGVNCFRFFEGRGFRLWGARTISDDPEWKYISVRRYFAYMEYSIERGTQWAVFENNNERLWANVRRTIEDFLYNEWRRGGLLGEKPEHAYFVRCDRSTMTQNDLDNGRLVCLIGVAPVKPAEFVIFRIGQWTADSPLT